MTWRPSWPEVCGKCLYPLVEPFEFEPCERCPAFEAAEEPDAQPTE